MHTERMVLNEKFTNLGCYNLYPTHNRFGIGKIFHKMVSDICISDLWLVFLVQNICCSIPTNENVDVDRQDYTFY